jgi:hypothetical protein
MSFLSGYRSYIAGAGTIIGGLLLLADGKTGEGVTAILAGLGTIFARVGAKNEAAAVAEKK